MRGAAMAKRNPYWCTHHVVPPHGRQRNTLNNARALIVAVADTHCGSTLGLCHPDGYDGGDEGLRLPSRGQRWLWDRWLEFIADAKRAATKRRVYLLLVGDLIDGDHHESVQLMTAEATGQRQMARAALAPLIELADRLFVCRGTEAHVGPIGGSEEALAEAWAADGRTVRAPAGTWSWWEIRADIGGALVDASHHCSAGNRAWTVGGAAVRIASEAILAARSTREREPDLVLRAHVHRYHDSGDLVQPTRCVVLPAWQLRTAYAMRRAILPADIGGLIAEVDGGRLASVRVPRYAPPQAPYWREDAKEGK